MNNDDYKCIESKIQHYINGAKSGKGNDMKPAFHQDATIFGYIGTDLFAGPIKSFLIGMMKMDLRMTLSARLYISILRVPLLQQD